MKAITFICLAFFFYSCTKTDVSVGGGGWGGFTAPNFTPIVDSANKLQIDLSGPIAHHLSAIALQTYLSRWKFPGDSTAINISASDSLCSIQLQFTNILTIGTYNFGTIIPGKKEAIITCYVQKPDSQGGGKYVNDKNVLSGTLSIDTITDHHIHGSFSVNCFKGTQQLTISNGSFAGNY